MEMRHLPGERAAGLSPRRKSFGRPSCSEKIQAALSSSQMYSLFLGVMRSSIMYLHTNSKDDILLH